MGTNLGVHQSKRGFVWVEYQSNAALYEVPLRLLFPSTEDTEKHQQEVAGGKKKAKPPANPSNPQPNPRPNPPTKSKPKLNPTNPTNPLAQEQKGG